MSIDLKKLCDDERNTNEVNSKHKNFQEEKEALKQIEYKFQQRKKMKKDQFMIDSDQIKLHHNKQLHYITIRSELIII